MNCFKKKDTEVMEDEMWESDEGQSGGEWASDDDDGGTAIVDWESDPSDNGEQSSKKKNTDFA